MNLFAFDPTLVERIGWTLVHSVWLFTLVALLTEFMSKTLFRSVRWQYASCCVGMATIVLLAFATFAVSASVDGQQAVANAQTELRLIDSSVPAANHVVDAEPIASPTLALSAEKTLTTTDDEARSMTATGLSVKQQTANGFLRSKLWLIVYCWFAGVVLLALRPLHGLYHVARLRRLGRSDASQQICNSVQRLSKRLGIARTVDVAMSAMIEVPSVVGHLRPLLLLPASAVTGLTTQELESIIAHELAHVRRYDYLLNVAQTAIETLFFYHPAVWWMSHRMRQLREHCCDDIAVEICGSRATYASALSAVESSRGTPSQPALAANGGNLVQRIRRLGHPPRRTFPSLWTSVAALGVMVACLSTNIIQGNGNTVNATEPSANPLEHQWNYRFESSNPYSVITVLLRQYTRNASGKFDPKTLASGAFANRERMADECRVTLEHDAGKTQFTINTRHGHKSAAPNQLNLTDYARLRSSTNGPVKVGSHRVLLARYMPDVTPGNETKLEDLAAFVCVEFHVEKAPPRKAATVSRFGGIMPQFDPEVGTWYATHIVLADGGDQHDGQFRVLESWKGDLAPGRKISLPELKLFQDAATRKISDWHVPRADGDNLEVVTGRKMVLFLIKSDWKEGGEWLSAMMHVGGHRHYLDYSVVWVEGANAYAIKQPQNPGPNLIVPLEGGLEKLRADVDHFIDVKSRLGATLQIEDLAKRDAALRKFTESDSWHARRLAKEHMQALRGSGLGRLILEAQYLDAEVERPITPLGSGSQQVRDDAAKQLRESYVPPGREKWDELLKQTKPGQSKAVILDRFGVGPENLGFGAGTGPRHSESYRLDDRWVLSGWFRNDNNKLEFPCELTEQMRGVPGGTPG